MRLYPDGVLQQPVITLHDDGPTWSLRQLLADRRFWLIVVLGSCCYCVVSVLVINLVSIASASHYTGEQSSLLISCVAACGVIGKLGFGVLYETTRRRNMVRIPVVCLFLACLLLWTSHQYVTMLLASAAIGLAMGANTLIAPILAGQFFGRQTFTFSLGVINPFLTISLVVILPIFGGLFDVYNSYRPGFALLLLLLAIVVMVTPLLPERTGQRS
jgi:MFS family permease